MHLHFIGAVMTLWHLIPPASSRNLNLVPPTPSSCPDPDTPKAFTLRQITYLRYETSPYTFSPQPNTTQLVFELENETTGVTTGCACQNVMRSDGTWADDSEFWYACVDKTLPVSGVQTVVVKTSAHVDWDDWRLSVNQTWRCEER
ncbi:hypothetical protein F5Y09DRAFT_286990 [Xylaria sp. FL1042]|nr:hypothetical protein F5Y09DRAFT_286990 [Xylaria sp. FL1042]